MRLPLINAMLFVCSSPDSDDTYPGEEPEEDFSMRDDQFLVSDRTENKFYGKIDSVPVRNQICSFIILQSLISNVYTR